MQVFESDVESVYNVEVAAHMREEDNMCLPDDPLEVRQWHPSTPPAYFEFKEASI